MNVPFLDLRAQYQSIKHEIDPAIHAVLDRCDFVGGKAIAEFEQAFAAYCQAQYCTAVSNGTDAIYLGLRALGIGPGDEVISVPNTFIGTTGPISRTGARVRFVDINPETLNIDVTKIENAINHRTKAIVPVHLYGQPAEMDAILQIAREHELKVLEDAAQAHGAKYRDRRVGGLADVACFSFYPGKNLGAYGDGGAVVTNDEAIANKVRILRDAGRVSKYEHAEEGFNHRLDTIQAAVLGVKLRHLDAWNQRRRQIAARYRQHFAGQAQITPVTQLEHVESVYHLFVIRIDNRDRVQAMLADKGIGTIIHYPIPLHLQPAYGYLGYSQGDFPVTEAAAPRLLSLPMYAEMTDDMVDFVAAQVIKATEQ